MLYSCNHTGTMGVRLNQRFNINMASLSCLYLVTYRNIFRIFEPHELYFISFKVRSSSNFTTKTI